MNKQILLIITLLGLQAPALAMDSRIETKRTAAELLASEPRPSSAAAPLVDSKTASEQAYRAAQETIRNAPTRTTHRAEDYPSGSAMHIRLAAEEKRAAEADVVEFEHIRIRRNSLDNGQFEEEHRTRTNQVDTRANHKINQAVKSKQAYRAGLVRKIAHEKDVLWKSAGALALTVFVCMHMHKHNHVERIAEHYGPMAAHAIQVIATLALGTSVKTMWEAGMNAYSKWPDAIKKVDIEIEKEEAKKVSPARVKEKVRTKNFDERPWPKRARVAPLLPHLGAATPSSADEKAASAAAAERPEGAGLGL